MSTTSPSQRVNFYGRRVGKAFSARQQDLYDKLLPKLLWDGAFPESWRGKTVCLEVGFGGGEHLAAQLTQNTNMAFIGVEPFRNGMVKLLTQVVEDESLQDRLRLWDQPLQDLIGTLPPAAFDKVYMLFPDPWPKKRHQKRRLFSKDVCTQMQRLLKDGGKVILASDDTDYVKQMIRILNETTDLSFECGAENSDPTAWPAWPNDWPITRYGQKALREGRSLAHMVWRKDLQET